MKGKLQKLMGYQQEQVLTASWLAEQGYSPQLVQGYVKHGWLVPIARGAFVRNGHTFTWDGGLQAIQKQLQLPVHLGGRSALKIQGVYHYARTTFDVLLCGPAKTLIPAWYVKACEGHYPYYAITYSWLKDWDLGLTKVQVDNGFEVTVAGIERAMLELLSLVPQHYGYDEATYLMESLTLGQVDVPLIQALLEASTHVKANRLFLHLAHECGHRWLEKIDHTNIELGSGYRVLPGATRCDAAYKLYIPDTPLNEGWGNQHGVF